MIFSLLTLSLSCILYSASLQKRTPFLVFELYRHGARYPQADAVSSPLGKYIPEEITGNGIRMHYMLGQKIRSDYPFIGSSNSGYLPSNITKVYASYSQRTYLSALAHMNGMLPPGTGQKITVNQPNFWLPPQEVSVSFSGGQDNSFSLPYGQRIVDIKSFSKGRDNLFLEYWEDCEVFNLKSQDQYNEFSRKHFKQLEPFRQAIKNTKYASSIKPDHNGDLKQLFHIADGEEAYYNLMGKHMEDINDSIAEKADILRAINNVAFTGMGKDLLKMRTYPFVKKIIKNIEKKLIKPKEYENLRYVGFSGHQSNLTPFIVKFGLTSAECLFKLLNGEKVQGVCEKNPPYAANILWEVSKDNATGEIYVQTKYNGKDIQTCKNSNPQDLACPFKEFKEYMENEFYLEKPILDKFCSRGPPPGFTLGIIVLIFFLVVFAVVIVAQCGIICSIYKENKNMKRKIRSKGPILQQLGTNMNQKKSGDEDDEFYMPLDELNLDSSNHENN